MTFPADRPRRLRSTERLRDLVAETDALAAQHLVYPLFVREGRNEKRDIPSMPGCAQLSIDLLVDEVRRAEDEGVGGVILFGIPEKKDATGTSGRDPDGIVPRALRAIAEKAKSIVLVADVCLCEYTDHGHCGALDERGTVVNDETLPLLAEAAVAYARAGAHVVAPSDMMDGRVGEIRRALDAAGLADAAILSYAAKYASAFYGPFRDAAQSAPRSGDRRGYQMDPRGPRSRTGGSRRASTGPCKPRRRARPREPPRSVLARRSRRPRSTRRGDPRAARARTRGAPSRSRTRGRAAPRRRAAPSGRPGRVRSRGRRRGTRAPRRPRSRRALARRPGSSGRATSGGRGPRQRGLP